MSQDDTKKLFEYLESKHRQEALELLGRVPSMTNARDDFNNSPLHHAAIRNDLPLAKVLLGLKAEVDPKNDATATPLYFATVYGYTEMAALLLEAGADINAKTKDGMTALHAAANIRKSACLRLLLTLGANPQVKNVAGITPLDFAIASKHPDNIKMLEGALARCIHRRHMELLDKNQPRHRNKINTTP